MYLSHDKQKQLFPNSQERWQACRHHRQRFGSFDNDANRFSYHIPGCFLAILLAPSKSSKRPWQKVSSTSNLLFQTYFWECHVLVAGQCHYGVKLVHDVCNKNITCCLCRWALVLAIPQAVWTHLGLKPSVSLDHLQGGKDQDSPPNQHVTYGVQWWWCHQQIKAKFQ